MSTELTTIITSKAKGYDPAFNGPPPSEKLVNVDEYTKITMPEWKTAVKNLIPPLPELPKISLPNITGALTAKINGLRTQAADIKNNLKAEEDALIPKEPPKIPTVDIPSVTPTIADGD